MNIKKVLFLFSGILCFLIATHPSLSAVKRSARKPKQSVTGPGTGIPLLIGETIQRIPEENIPEEAKIPLPMYFKDMEVIDAIQVISDKGKLNIVTKPDIKGKVTFFMEEISMWDAFNLIIELNDLAYVPKENNIIKVITAKEYEKLFGKNFYDKRRRKILQPRHAKVKDIHATLKQMKTKIGQIIVDERTNSLIIFDNPEEVEEVEKIIAQLDFPITTRVFKLYNTTPAVVKAAIDKMIPKSGRVEIDVKTNRIIVTDVSNNVDDIAKIIKAYDEKPDTITEVFSLNYADPKGFKEKIDPELTPDKIGSVQVDERTRKVIVTDFPEKIEHIGKIIAALDEKTREVDIEAKIIQVILNDHFKMGVNWEYVLSQFDDMNIKQTFNILGATDPGNRITIGTLADDRYAGLIEILKTIGETNTLSSPRITAVDGKEAKILIGSTIPYKTTTTIVEDGITRTEENVTKVDVGVKLHVTPEINPAGFVTMEIKPEVSSVTEYRDDVPVVETSETETKVMVKDGVSIVIAGLIKDEQIKTINKVPVLGDIPFLGPIFFKKTDDEVKKTELIILITPHIISGEVSTEHEYITAGEEETTEEQK